MSGVLISHVLAVVATLVVTSTAFYFGLLRDRSNLIRKEQVQVATRLNEKLINIEKNELSDHRSTTLHINILSGPQRTENLSEEEVQHLGEWTKYKEELRIEESRARLWLHTNTVSAISDYSILLMLCKDWESQSSGKAITEDEQFLLSLKCLFGRRWKKVLRDVVVVHSITKKDWLINCTKLSRRCRDNIQRRIFCQIKHTLWFAIRESFRLQRKK